MDAAGCATLVSLITYFIMDEPEYFVMNFQQSTQAEQGGAANRLGRSVAMLSVTPTRPPRSTRAPAPAVG